MKQIDRSLFSEAERLAAIYPDALITLISRDGRIEYISFSCQHILEYDASELLWQDFSSLIAPEQLTETVSLINEAIDTDHPVEVIARIRTKAGLYQSMRGFAYQLVDTNTDETYLLTRAEPVPV